MDIQSLRNEIDSIDQKIIQQIQARFLIVQKIANYKKHHQLDIVDQSRSNEVIQKNCEFARSLDLDPVMIERIFTEIIAFSVQYQSESIAAK